MVNGQLLPLSTAPYEVVGSFADANVSAETITWELVMDARHERRKATEYVPLASISARPYTRQGLPLCSIQSDKAAPYAL